jgi:acid stress chaperone HdeB
MNNMTSKTLTSLILGMAVTAMLVTATAQADNQQKIDLAAMTCRQFVQADDKSVDLVMAWLLGFYAGEDEPQVLDLAKLDTVRKSFMAFCKEQPGFRLTTAAEGIFGK